MIKIRTCINCKNKNNKDSLIRFSTNNSKLVIDSSQKINSRGFYLCNDINCIGSLKDKISKNKFKSKNDINLKELSELLDTLLEGMEK